ncbi:MAG TPA: sugar phosphate isomerase/epimerase [Actinobacteria bacterium]|jgi:sugar phosphate isomerase/epimerase|nr:sugar phosphate isomerase/epimerase [Actinomycetota bacterium]
MRPVTIFTGQWADLSFEEMCRIASEIGYEGLELATWGNHVNPKRAAEEPAYVKEILDTLKKYNLKTWAISAHLSGQLIGDVYDKRHNGFAASSVADKPKEMREWAVQEVRYTIKAAKNLGINMITGFLGSPIWNYWYSFPQTTAEMVDDGYKTIVERWSPLFDEMDKNGIRFALEVHPTEIAYDYYSFVRLLEEFKYRETLGMNFDPSHLLWQGLKPHLMIREIPDRVYHVHIKDASVTLDGLNGILGSHLEFGDPKRGWNFRSPGRGGVDFSAIIRELNAIGYDGPLSVEWEDSGMDRIQGATEACSFVKHINITPNVGAFDDALKNK